jgi:hypothetical protein
MLDVLVCLRVLMAKEFMYTAIVWLHDFRTLSLEVQGYCHCSI